MIIDGVNNLLPVEYSRSVFDQPHCGVPRLLSFGQNFEQDIHIVIDVVK